MTAAVGVGLSHDDLLVYSLSFYPPTETLSKLVWFCDTAAQASVRNRECYKK